MDSPTVSEMPFVPQMTIAPAPARPLALRVGFDMKIETYGKTPILMMLYAHPEVADRLDAPEERIVAEPALPIETFLDGFGNKVGRIVVPSAGVLHIRHETTYTDTYAPEAQPSPTAEQHGAGDLPHDVLPYLLGSRYCEVDRLGSVAWDLFGDLKHGGERALAINTWVFQNIFFSYRLTRPNKTALDTYAERNGVCRDMMHLAISFCRAMNIPARYATGYLGDIDADPDPTPMDYSAFYEVYLDGQWWAMDARHGKARVGRVLMGRGRDAADVALLTTFGRHRLAQFTVITDELPAPQPAKIGGGILALSA